MDPLLIGGLLLVVGALILSMLVEGHALAPLLSSGALMLVLGATFGVTLMSVQLADLKRVPGAMMVALRGKVPSSEEHLGTLITCAEVARKEGVLALERRLDDIDDEFVKEGLQLIVDGTDGEHVRGRLETFLEGLDRRHQSAQRFFKTLGGYSPTVGMIGTVIGLVNMLGELEDPEQLGLGMALALLTTLYGVMFANLLFLPFASKLERLHEMEIRSREIALDGILAIQAGASPRLLVERMEGHLPPERRLGYEERMAAAREEAAARQEAAA